MFSLVKFIDEGSIVGEDGTMTYPIEVISTSWISTDKSTCLFPPRNVNFDTAVKKHFKPTEKWADCKIEIAYSKDSLQKVRRKRQEYEAGSSIEDSGESEEEIPRRNPILSSQIVSPTKIPVPTTSFNSNFSSQNEEVNLRFNSGGFNSQEREASENVILMKDTTGFEELVLRKLAKISRLLKDLTGEVRDLKSCKNVATNNLNMVGLPSLPLSSFDDMGDMDVFLRVAEDTTNFEVVLARTGGKNVKEATERILESLLKDELAELYSWAGKKNKKNVEKQKVAFKRTELINKKVIFKAVNRIHNESKDSDVENFIKDWLKYAPSRRKHNN